MRKFISRNSIVCILLALCMMAGLVPLAIGSRVVYAESVSEPVSETLTVSDGWIYQLLKDGTALLLGHTDASVKALSLPESVDSIWVSGVGKDAFSAQTLLERVTIPSSIRHIDATAFSAQAALVVRGYHGSAAMTFARNRGAAFSTLSSFDFRNDVLDLSGMSAGQWRMTGSTLEVDAPYSALIRTGAKLYLPPCAGYSKGRPVTVSAVTGSGTVYAVVEDLDFTETLASYEAHNIHLVPDYSSFVPAEGVTMGLSAVSKGDLAGSLPLNVTWHVDESTQVTLSSSLSLDAYMDVDYDGTNFSLYQHDVTVSMKDINLTVTSGMPDDASKFATQEVSKYNMRVKRIGKINLGSTALVSAWAEVYVKYSLSGSVSVYCPSISITHHAKWTELDGFSQSLERNTNPFSFGTLKGELKLGPEVDVSVRIGFLDTKFSVKVASFSMFVGFTLQAQLCELTPCADIQLTFGYEGSLKIGWIESKKKIPGVAQREKGFIDTYLEWKLPEAPPIEIMKKHLENLETLQDVCDYADNICTVEFVSRSADTFPAQQVEKGDYASHPGTPIRAGYTFTGWYKDAACTDYFYFFYPVEDNHLVLYAGWKSEMATPTPEIDSFPYSTPSPTPRPTMSMSSPTPVPQVTDYYTPIEYPADHLTAGGLTSGALYTVLNKKFSEPDGGWLITGINTGQDFVNDDYDRILTYQIFDHWESTITPEQALGLTMPFTPLNYPHYFHEVFRKETVPYYFSLNIPSTMYSHDPGACGHCYLGACDNPQYPVVGFSDSASVYRSASYLTSVTLPRSFDMLPSGIFSGADRMKTFNFSGIKKIGATAFQYSALESVVLDSGTVVDTSAFNHCAKLTKLVLPNDTERVVLLDCAALPQITIPTGAAYVSLTDCRALTSLTIPDGVESVTLDGCISLKTLTVGANVKNVRITNCPALETVTLSSGVEKFHIEPSMM